MRPEPTRPPAAAPAWLAALAGALLLAAGCGKAPPRGDRPDAGTAAAGGRPAAETPRPVEITTQAGDVMVLVPGGTFLMGSRTGPPEERPPHLVRVDPFLMDRCEITQEHFARLQLPDPSHFKNPRHPVDQANWTDAARFCNERSRAEGLRPCYDESSWACDFTADGYRLPTEAEWEYACRAGTAGEYSFGDDPRALGAHAWFAGNAGGTTHPVGQKRPNPWGLCDLHGNVAEWCNDAFDTAYYRNSPQDNPTGPETPGPERVVRGGSWKSPAERCRAAARAGDRSVLDTCTANDTLGFRCVRRAPPGMAGSPGPAPGR